MVPRGLILPTLEIPWLYLNYLKWTRWEVKRSHTQCTLLPGSCQKFICSSPAHGQPVCKVFFLSICNLLRFPTNCQAEGTEWKLEMLSSAVGGGNKITGEIINQTNKDYRQTWQKDAGWGSVTACRETLLGERHSCLGLIRLRRFPEQPQPQPQQQTFPPVLLCQT